METIQRLTNAYIAILCDIWQDIIRFDAKHGGYGAAYFKILQDIYLDLLKAAEEDKLPSFLFPTIAIIVIACSFWIYTLLIYLT